MLGVTERYKKAISRVKKGDKCLFYIKRGREETTNEPLISSECVVVSALYEDNKQIFKAPTPTSNETYPLRLDLECLMPSAKPIPFKPLIPKLSFIKNKDNWGGTLQWRALLQIPESDFLTVLTSF